MQDTAAADVAASFNPQDGNGFDELYEEMARARREAPVFYWERFGMWVVSRHDDVVRILKDGERFSNRDILSFLPLDEEAKRILLDAGVPTHFDTTWMNLVDGADHQRMRSSVNRAFTPRQVARLEPMIVEFAGELLDALPGESFDLIADFSYPLPIQVILALIDVPRSDMDDLRVWSDDLTALAAKAMEPDEQIRCARSAVLFDEYVQRLIEERRRTPGDDFLSLVLLDVAEGRSDWSERELRYLVTHGLILAGHETTKAAISNGVHLLLREPERWDALVAAPDRIPAVVEELLRLTPPAIGYFRRPVVDVEVAGVTIPKGAQIYALLLSANTDETHYQCPYEVRMDRPTAEQFHVSFSFGRHVCLGAPLARLEYRIALSQLTARFPGLRLAEGFEPEYEPSLLTRHLKRLPVVTNGRSH